MKPATLHSSPAALFLGLALLYPADALALPCADWDADIQVSESSSVPSIAMSIGWDSAPASCTNAGPWGNWTGTDHYEVYRREGEGDNAACADNTTSFSSTGPSGGEILDDDATSPTTDFVHRSNKDFRYFVRACMNAGCSRYYGQALGETTSNDEAYDCTLAEKWLIEEVDDFDQANWDTGVDWVLTPGSASGALFYPSGFTDSSSSSITDTLGIWWSTSCDGVDETKKDCVYQKRAQDTGTQDWNSYSNWTSDTKVYEETGGSQDFAYLSHPWIAAAEDGSGNQSVWVWSRRNDVGNPGDHVIAVESVDEEGLDAAVECTDTDDCELSDGDTCLETELCDFEDISGDGDGVGEISVCVDGDASCTNDLYGARHGRIMHNYVDHPTLNLTTGDYSMVFTGAPDGTTCTQVSTNQDDLYRAEWDTTNQEWDVVLSSGCPEPQGSYGTYMGSPQDGDMHDPGVLPLPDGEFKMYAEREQGTLFVLYWNPVSEEWEDVTEIEIYLDDGSGGFGDDASACIDNIDVVVNPGPPPVEAMFFKARAASQTSGCFVGSGSEAPGILYAKHNN